MGNFVDEFAGLLIATIEVPGESNAEAASKALIVDSVNALNQAQKLQALSDAGDAEILGVSSSLMKLALQFNKAFKHLTADQKAEINDVVKGIVTGANQEDIETFFDLTLNAVGTAQDFSAELAVLLETDPPQPA